MNFRNEGTPTPGVFLQEWQTKGLWLTEPVRVTTTGLKVVGFSVSCGWAVRVAGKGLTEGTVKRLEGLRVEMLKVEGREPNAEALSAHREEKKGEGEDDWTECDETMTESSMVSDYCQGLLSKENHSNETGGSRGV
jgi:hypothetical protein